VIEDAEGAPAEVRQRRGESVDAYAAVAGRIARKYGMAR